MNVFQIDAKIEELKAEIALLQIQRQQTQNGCEHVFGDRQWMRPGCHEDPPEGDYFKSCLKCKTVKLLND
jgi:hypothetical protein